MIPMVLGDRPSGVVTLGAHPDDIEIGCGGTLLQLAARWPGLRVDVVLLTGSPDRLEEARTACSAFLAGCEVRLHAFDLPDGRLPSVWGTAKQHLEEVAAIVRAEGGGAGLIIGPRQDDAHQDHRTLAELIPTVWRDELVLGYEIPKYDGDLGRPSVYVPMSSGIARRKVELLDRVYPSQVARDWWDAETFLGLARLRGIECRSRYAEAFTLSKAILAW